MALESVAFERLDVDETQSNALDDDFDALYRRFYPRLVATCRRRVADDALAEDIAQETLIRALTHRDAFDRRRPAWPWLKTIATNLIVDHYRKHMRETLLAEQDGGAVEQGPSFEEADLLRRAIQQLPRRQRAAVALRYLNDWDAQDAASFMGVTRPAYEQLLFRARRRLKVEYRRLSQELSAGVAAGSASLRALARRAGNRMRELGANTPSMADLTSMTGAQIASGAIAFAIAVGGQPLSASPAVPETASRAPVAAVTSDANARQDRSATRNTTDVARGQRSTGVPAVAAATTHDDDSAANGRSPLGEMTNDGVSQPEDVHITSIVTASEPNGSAYAVGRANCLSDTCPSVLFRSSDGGATWTRLPAEHFNSETLLVPPRGGDAAPIFGMGRVGLQVSRDGGQTFTPAAPTGAPNTVGSAAISPAFTSGDPTILIGAQTLMRYRDDLGVVEPAPWMTGSGPLQPAFAPQYPFDDRIVVGGLVANPESGRLTSGVHTCTAMLCSYAPVGEMALRVDVRLAPDFATSHVEYAFTDRAIHVSNDGGRTFLELSAPWKGIVEDVAVGTGGRVFAAVRGNQAGVYSSSDGGATWTEVPYELFVDGASSIGMAGDRVMVALAGTGLACSSDAGVAWSTRCSSPN